MSIGHTCAPPCAVGNIARGVARVNALFSSLIPHAVWGLQTAQSPSVPLHLPAAQDHLVPTLVDTPHRIGCSGTPVHRPHPDLLLHHNAAELGARTFSGGSALCATRNPGGAWMMNRLLVHYCVDVQHPEVSGAEHLEMLQLRD
jgi:hypothetical protein